MRRNLTQIIDRYRRYKRAVVPISEAALFAAILFIAYWLRLGQINEKYFSQMLLLAVLFVPAKITLFWIFRLYHITFRYTSFHEIIKILKASLTSAAFLSLITLLISGFSFMKGYPRSVVFIDSMLTFLLSSGLRLVFRFIYFPELVDKGEGKKVLIVGAGYAGGKLIRELKIASANSSYVPVALVDDDPSKQGGILHGIKVMGSTKDIPRITEGLGIDEIIIAIPSASSARLKEIMEHVRNAGVKNVKIIPGLSHILDGNITLSDIRDVLVEDILAREPVNTELEGVASYLKGKRVLVTGAGGSIGSELCRQIAALGPACLIMADVGDSELFYIDREIKEKFSLTTSVSMIVDVKDMVGMRHIFEHYFPQVVFHAAAYKHVPLMESSPREAVLNNVQGTKIPALLSIINGVEKFIFISTDKAVNPTSVMGVTKRIAENLLRSLNGKNTKFVSVRFGNVLESRGSVVPIFKSQIKNGGPVTVTHPDMVRYFMSITEAVFLVLQAGTMGNGGEVFVLDMGKPVKILNLAHDMIRFYGLEPDKDIPIVFTGLRPGEKLFEEILTSEEGTMVTKHEKILIARDTNKLDPRYMEKVEGLIKMAMDNSSRESILYFLKELVPTYRLKAVQPLDAGYNYEGSQFLGELSPLPKFNLK